MDKMKDSGIEWIGEIPEEWKIKKYKHFAKSGMGQTILKEDLVEEGIPVYSATQEDKIFGYIGKPNLVLKKGDFVIPARGNSIGFVYAVNEDTATCTQTTIYSRIKGINREYLYYSSMAFKDNWFGYTQTAIPQITVEQVQNNSVLVPPDREQHQIATFLDQKVGQVNKTISNLEKQVEKLTDYKKSLITEVVTKGLDRDVEMKDSGVEWIGEIPKDWEVKKLKHVFNIYAGGDVSIHDTSEDWNENYRFPIYSNSLQNNGLFGYTNSYRFSGKTITVTGRGEVGIAVNREDRYYPIVRLLVCEPKLETENSYFTHCINSADISGEKTAMEQLTAPKLGDTKVAIPNIDECTILANYIDKKVGQVDTIISQKQSQIQIMNKYKKSLIYEYVTGKKRVKGSDQLGS